MSITLLPGIKGDQAFLGAALEEMLGPWELERIATMSKGFNMLSQRVIEKGDSFLAVKAAMEKWAPELLQDWPEECNGSKPAHLFALAKRLKMGLGDGESLDDFSQLLGKLEIYKAQMLLRFHQFVTGVETFEGELLAKADKVRAYYRARNEGEETRLNVRGSPIIGTEKVKVLPAEICSLMSRCTDLNLSYGDLRFLPPQIGLMSRVQMLVLSYNPRLRSLPDSVADLAEMHTLILHGNAGLKAAPEKELAEKTVLSDFWKGELRSLLK